ncbi:chromosome partitioning protein ParB (plasmid) [Pseudomonas avellanae]|uniref:Chromosome partitioning protein ParB n=4 Tax=Pseudomonas TaxID=286 RepID=A0AAD0M6Q1_9PSED|nr:chromosome partitioning protein ParB [Pseudomonas avellanae]PHN34516.1 chromosome partitioning protein ParB [Pseudomonas avellanae]POP74915.1 chromosome partitioning protein ParB [Pseudomonas amygdali pv. morsprunorum]
MLETQHMKSNDYPGKPKTGAIGLRTPAEIPAGTPSSATGRAAMLQKLDEKIQEPLVGEWIGKDQTLEDILVSGIVVSPYQPRMLFDSVAISRLVESIREIGLGKPILVRPLPNGQHELVGGERRWRAVTILGWDRIPAVVKPMSDDMAMLLALADNEHEELTDYELARSYDRYLQSGNDNSQSAIARRLGINRSIVSRCLDLMKLPSSIRQVLDQHPSLITANYAKKFVSFAEKDVHIVERQVLSMVDKGTKQEQALRQIAMKIAACSNQGRPAYVPRAVAGIGTIKLSGQKLELKCDKGVNPTLLMLQFEEFLKNIDRTKLAAAKAE